MNNTKYLSLLTLALIFLGSCLIWFSLKPQDQQLPISTPFPTPLVEDNLIATSSSVVGIEGERVLVTKVVDGDTVELERGEKVRLIGIDTPETKDPRRPVGCFGKEASNETKRLVEGKDVILQKDVSQTDKYGRLLRYVFLSIEANQILFVNDYLVREGFAKVLTYPPDVKYNERLREAEKEAKEGKRGLWGRC